MCSLFHTKCELHNPPKIQNSAFSLWNVALFASNVKTALLKSTLVSLSLAMKKRWNFNPAITCTFLSSFEHCELMSHICCFYSIECNEAFNYSLNDLLYKMNILDNKCSIIAVNYNHLYLDHIKNCPKFAEK